MNYIDLFAGAGGLSEGFIRMGFVPIAHVEMDKAACNTLRTRVAAKYLKTVGRYSEYISYLKGDISRTTLYSKIPAHQLDSVINIPIGEEHNEFIYQQIDSRLQGDKVDLIIGGPPCQAYSLVGRARSINSMEGDPRNFLYIQYGNFLRRYKPLMFVFENVIGIKSAKQGAYLQSMETLFRSIGYEMKLFTVDASNFGVLQNRRRVIIIGWQQKLSLSFPDLDSIRKAAGVHVNTLLDDLPRIASGEGTRFCRYRSETSDYLKTAKIRNGIDILTQHIARPHTEQDKTIYQIAVQKWNVGKKRLDYNDLPESLKTHANRTSFFDRFKVVAGDLSYAQTVVAHIAKDGHYYIHPDINQNRSLSVREAARLQSFPDDFFFEGVKEFANRTAAFKQIGNAVPPLMAEVIAGEIKRCLAG